MLIIYNQQVKRFVLCPGGGGNPVNNRVLPDFDFPSVATVCPHLLLLLPLS